MEYRYGSLSQMKKLERRFKEQPGEWGYEVTNRVTFADGSWCYGFMWSPRDLDFKITRLVDHLRSRHMNLDLHRPMLDPAEDVATFWLYTLTGQIAGYHQYRPTGQKGKAMNMKDVSKYYTWYSKELPVQPRVWGLESFNLTPTVFLCEGMFDAARLTERGVSALATLSNDPGKQFMNWVRSTGRRFVAICDNDAAGRKLAKYGTEAVFCEDGKDLGDASDEYVSSLLRRFGY